MANTIWKELNQTFPKGESKKYYFLWRNGLKNASTDFTKFDEESFIDKYCKGSERQFEFLKQWEKSEQYASLLQVYMNQELTGDIYEVYKVVKDKALQGDNNAIKTLLMLQKEVKKNLGKGRIGKEEIIEDDGLSIE